MLRREPWATAAWAGGLGLLAAAVPAARPAALRFGVATTSLCLHGAVQARAAAALGDPGPRRLGRARPGVTAHFGGRQLATVAAMSTLAIGIPVPAQPVALARGRLLQQPNGRRRLAQIHACGPLTHLVLAALGAAGLALAVGYGSPLAAALGRGVLGFNVASFFFNLLPLAPCDGQPIVAALLPEPWAVRFDQFSRSDAAHRLYDLLWLLGLLGSINPVAWPAAHVSGALRRWSERAGQ